MAVETKSQPVPAPYYQDPEAQITLYCGDMIDIIPALRQVDPFRVVITDPPWYGAQFVRAQNARLLEYDAAQDVAWIVKQMSWYSSWLTILGQLNRLCQAWTFIASGPDHWPFMLRVAALDNWTPEHIWYSRAQALTYWGPPLPRAVVTRIGEAYQECGFHRQMSQPLLDVLLDSVDPGPVFDPFCGEGATLIAAKRRGWPAWGIEIDPEICAKARAILARSPRGG